MSVSIWEVAKAARRWPVIGLIDRQFRDLPVDSRGDEGLELSVVRGSLTRDGSLLALNDIRFRSEHTLMLLDGAATGAEVVTVGRLRSTPDARGSFRSYRQSPKLKVLTEGCVMGAAAWTYFRSHAILRAFYRAVGLLVGARETVGGGLPDRRRAAGAICVGCLAATVVAIAAFYVHGFRQTIGASWNTMAEPLPSVTRSVVADPSPSAEQQCYAAISAWRSKPLR